jgi:hypothetical protein
VRHETHLTVYLGCVKADNVENYGHKGGPARNGVDLYSSRSVTWVGGNETI